MYKMSWNHPGLEKRAGWACVSIDRSRTKRVPITFIGPGYLGPFPTLIIANGKKEFQNWTKTIQRVIFIAFHEKSQGVHQQVHKTEKRSEYVQAVEKKVMWNA